MDNPKVSIILTSHNRPQLLTQAINSIFKQTIPDWELIIIDDFSTDNSVLDVLKEAKKDPRARVFRTNYDVDNIAVLWNLALDRVKGKYIAFLDDDNRKKPTFCEEMSDFLDKHNQFEAVACFNQIIKDNILTEEVWDNPKHVNKYNIINNNYVDSGCMMIRHSLINKIGWFDERLRTAEDWDYVKRIVLQTNGFGIIEKPLAEYRWHKENRMYRSESLGSQTDLRFIKFIKNYNSKLKILLFSQDKDKITLSQNNVLSGIYDALKLMEFVNLEALSVNQIGSLSSYYDIIFCFAPFSIDLECIKTLQMYGSEVIHFHIEDPQALGINLERVKYATYVFTNDISVIDKYEQIIGKGNVGYCCSISLNDIRLKFRDKVKKKYNIIFSGYPYDSRVEFIKKLEPQIKKIGYNLTLVGGDWSKRGIDLPCIDEISEQNLLKVMEESKITLLYNRRNTDLGGDSRSIRPVSVVRGYFECGSDSLVLLDSERPHHSFNDEIIFYHDINDLVEKIDYYMKAGKERIKIAKLAKEKALRDFTYQVRIRKLLTIIRSKRYYSEVK